MNKSDILEKVKLLVVTIESGLFTTNQIALSLKRLISEIEEK